VAWTTACSDGVEVLGEQRGDALRRQRQEAFRVGSDLVIERGSFELAEQRAGGFPGVGCKGVDVDEPRDLGVVARLADNGTGIAVPDQNHVALRPELWRGRRRQTSASKLVSGSWTAVTVMPLAVNNGMILAQLEPSAHAP